MDTLFSLLVVPFLVLFIALAVIFALRAYKRGAIQSAISLGVTVVAIVLSLLLGKLLAPAIAGPLSSTLTGALGSAVSGTMFESLLTGKTAANLIGGVCSAIASLPIFLVLETVLLLVAKLVVSSILKKKMPAPENKGLKIGGAVIGVLDAFLIAFFTLLPIYGTADATVRIGKNFVESADADNKIAATLKDVVDPLSKSGIVKFYGNGLARSAYDSLTTFKNASGSVSLATLGETFAEIAQSAVAGDTTAAVNVAVQKMHKDPVYREIVVDALDDIVKNVPTNNGSGESTLNVAEVLGTVAEEDKEKEAVAISNVMAAYEVVQAASDDSEKFSAAVDMMEAAIDHPNIEPAQVVSYIQDVIPAATEGSSKSVEVLNDATFMNKLESNLTAVKSGSMNVEAAKSDLMSYYYAYVQKK